MPTNISEQKQDGPVADTALLDVLGDECSRAILAAAGRESMTAKELTNSCDVSPATVYRRINTLLDHGLLEESIEFSANSGRQKVYKTTFSHVDIDLTDDGFEVASHEQNGGSYHLMQLLSEMPFEHVRADAVDRELTVKIGLTDEMFEQFVEFWGQSSQ
jgi:predicted transcriptional regulator